MISSRKTPENSRYPVHYLVWHNKHRQLEKELAATEQVRRGIAMNHRHGAVSSFLCGHVGRWISGWSCTVDAIHGASHLGSCRQYVGIAQLIAVSGVEGATCNAKIWINT